jgi:hypothetical protein
MESEIDRKRLVDTRNHNPRVGGSSPSSATNDFNILDRRSQKAWHRFGTAVNAGS